MTDPKNLAFRHKRKVHAYRDTGKLMKYAYGYTERLVKTCLQRYREANKSMIPEIQGI
jgi:hypothetical protein